VSARGRGHGRVRLDWGWRHGWIRYPRGQPVSRPAEMRVPCLAASPRRFGQTHFGVLYLVH